MAHPRPLDIYDCAALDMYRRVEEIVSDRTLSGMGRLIALQKLSKESEWWRSRMEAYDRNNGPKARMGFPPTLGDVVDYLIKRGPPKKAT